MEGVREGWGRGEKGEEGEGKKMGLRWSLTPDSILFFV